MVDNLELNGYAFSKHCVILTTGFINSATDEELMAVIAHELGHLYYGDSQILMGALWVEFPTRIFDRAYRFLLRLCLRSGWIAWIFILPFLIILLPFWLLARLNNWIFKFIDLLWSQSSEYRADYHAYRLGYAGGMISFLEKIVPKSKGQTTFFADLIASHPVPMKRINRIEGYISERINVTYDVKLPKDKFLPTLVLSGILCGSFMWWSQLGSNNLANKPKIVQHGWILTLESAGYQEHKKVSKRVVNNHSQSANPDITVAWVYIYNTTAAENHQYKIAYKLRNKGEMQYIVVKHQPRTYKISLSDLKVLQ